jgi:anti-sigma factor RsiW
MSGGPTGPQGPNRHVGPEADRCEQVRIDLGGYVLGALEPAERRAVDEHLAHCPDCRNELAELAEMPALLGRLTEAEAADGLAVDPSPALLDGLLARVSAERQRTRRRTLVSVAAVGIAAVLGSGIVTGAVVGGGGAAVTTAVAAQGVTASADLHSAAHGTAIDMSISGVPAGERCRLVVVDASGRQQVVSEWEVDYAGTARVHAIADRPPKQLKQLRVVTVEGTGLANMSVPAST